MTQVTEHARAYPKVHWLTNRWIKYFVSQICPGCWEYGTDMTRVTLSCFQKSIIIFYYKTVHIVKKKHSILKNYITKYNTQFSSVQSLSLVWLFATPWTAAHQASHSIINSQSPPKPMSIELVMPSNHLILCCPLLLLPSIFPSIRVFSNESALHIRWPKDWSFSFNISPSSEHPGLIKYNTK